jgi:hypothetical protein
VVAGPSAATLSKGLRRVAGESKVLRGVGGSETLSLTSGPFLTRLELSEAGVCPWRRACLRMGCDSVNLQPNSVD